MTADGERLKEHIWNKCMKLSIDMQYSKSKYLKGKYDALKELWLELGFDLKDTDPTESA